jgi:hypothetical protein
MVGDKSCTICGRVLCCCGKGFAKSELVFGFYTVLELNF